MKTTFYPGFPQPEPRRIAQIERYAAKLERFGAQVWLYCGYGATLDVQLVPDMPTLRLADDAPLPVALTAARVAAQICEAVENYHATPTA